MVRRNLTLARQAAQEVVEGIRSGALAGDDGLLPSETTLSQRIGVSRATLREALSQLEQGGLIVRRHGIGTFVSPRHPLVVAGLEELQSIETLAQRIGVEINMGECEIRERAAAPGEAEALQVPAATAVLAVQRVMLSGGRPIAFLIDVVPTDVLDPGELGESFDGSVLDFLLRRRDPPLKHSHTELGAEAADTDLAHRLHLRVGDPLLKFTAQLYAASGRVVDYSLSYFSPGHFRFHVIRRVNQIAPQVPEGPAPTGRAVDREEAELVDAHS
jgi:GntR family transcriptional regulator